MYRTTAHSTRHARHAPAPASRNAGSSNAFSTLRPAVLLLARTCLLPLASAAPLTSSLFRTFAEDEEPPKDAGDPDLYLYLSIGVLLVLLGGVFAGLTIALMGQDETYLQVISTSGEGSERKHAEKVLALLKKGKHWVLVTLLLSNVITNETLPIVLDRSLGGGWPAVLSSTVLIVIFGEIVPQSICVRYGLSIGAMMAPFVLVLMWIMYPVAYPTARLLDWLLGEDHGTTYKKAGLKTLVSLHKTLGQSPAERLMQDEVTIITSVLDLKEKPVGGIMTPMQDVFTMSADTVLDERMMDTILSQGYSRIPIYAPDDNSNFIGMLLVKILITYDPEDAKRVRDFSLATLPETAPHTSCLDIINFFQEGKSHMVLVSDSPGMSEGALGVVTLEDVIEELIGEEIIDESDVFIDVHKAIRRMAPAPRQRFRHSSMDPALVIGANGEPSKEEGEDQPLLQKEHSAPPSRKTSFTAGNTGAAATFLVRRKSSTSESTRDTSKIAPVPVRTNTTEMREHLRHLGPSNAASRPRATKYASVKIKPGVGTIPENQQTTKGVDEPHQRSGSVDMALSDEARLLRSAGKDASDGTAALKQSYGTMSPDSTTRKRGMSDGGGGVDVMSAKEASEIAEQKASAPTEGSFFPPQGGTESSPQPPGGSDRTNQRLKVPQKTVVGEGGKVDEEASDSLGDFGPPSRERSMRRQARSGSITETTVDVGGMKKVVLETTSSSSEEDADREGDDQGSGSLKGHQRRKSGKSGRSSRGGDKS